MSHLHGTARPRIADSRIAERGRHGSFAGGGYGLNVLREFAFFFFQAEDGIRDVAVTGVQTCALPIYGPFSARWTSRPSSLWRKCSLSRPSRSMARARAMRKSGFDRASLRLLTARKQIDRKSVV